MNKERIVRTTFDEKEKQWITKDYVELKQSSKLVKKKFRKTYDDLFKVYFQLTGSEPKVLSWIILNCNKHNFIKISYKDMSRKLNLSIDSIKKIMRKLQKLNALKNIGGIIYINPFMFVKDGSREEILQIEYVPIFKRSCNEKQ